MQAKKILLNTVLLGVGLIATDISAMENNTLKVCAAEDEMPYSNQKGEGFENKLAQLIGKQLNRKVEYVFWTDPRYYIRDFLEKGQCDLTLGVDKGDPRVLTTKPYYRSGYVFIYRENANFELENWDSDILRKVKNIAVVPGTPPEVMMRAIGRYNDMFNYSQELVGFKSRRNQYVKYEPSKLVSEVSSGHAEIAVLWGPSAARYVKQSATPLEMTVIPDNSVRADGQKVEHHFSTSIGVRKNDPTLLAQLNKVIEDQQDDITDLLEEEGIPLLDESPNEK
ncbi:MAG: methanol oxidation system protein MoxJ [Methylococcaceae bacterium]|nr:methanol oxidation system protein MoxJ [Methylococcaceae bacterium]